ncbi:MAG: integrase arm-type DNA-binding domain-containing protein [Burkholderiaceae bacterium]|nr:integrase arm-type DNA-binding domain-containing protein [Burkholderiaceae bacterium]
MPKLAKELTAIEVRRLIQPGLHAVGTVSGLCLCVKPTGARSWVLRTKIGNRRAELGLGGYPTVTLADAIEGAREALRKIRAGTDPAAERRATRKTVEWTFKRCGEAYIEAHRASWRNAKHGSQWENTLATYVYPKFGAKHVRDVSKADILAAIEPEWSTKNETMVRVRNRIELVLAWAMQREYRPEGPNPARWRGNLDAALPKPSKVNQREHFEAVAIDDMHAFMQRLQAAAGQGARALEFAILTASRTGAVRAAAWDEIDLEGRTWTTPGDKMKSGRPHRVPLSPRAVELLKTLPRFDAVPLVFPGTKGKPMSDMSLTAVMRRMELSAVPHGFRSTFSDWCAERTATPAEVREMALAHGGGDSTEEAYRRGDLFVKRRQLMDMWAEVLNTPPAMGNVVDMPKNRATR